MQNWLANLLRNERESPNGVSNLMQDVGASSREEKENPRTQKTPDVERVVRGEKLEHKNTQPP
jgi:hypothetical protein